MSLVGIESDCSATECDWNSSLECQEGVSGIPKELQLNGMKLWELEKELFFY